MIKLKLNSETQVKRELQLQLLRGTAQTSNISTNGKLDFVKVTKSPFIGIFPASSREREKIQTQFLGVHEMVDGLKVFYNTT